MCVVFDGTHQRLYVDGKPEGRVKLPTSLLIEKDSPLLNTHPLFIGQPPFYAVAARAKLMARFAYNSLLTLLVFHFCLLQLIRLYYFLYSKQVSYRVCCSCADLFTCPQHHRCTGPTNQGPAVTAAPITLIDEFC